MEVSYRRDRAKRIYGRHWRIHHWVDIILTPVLLAFPYVVVCMYFSTVPSDLGRSFIKFLNKIKTQQSHNT